MLSMRNSSILSSIKTFDFSTLYTTLPHDKLKTRLKETIHKAFSYRNYGSKFVVLGYNSTYFSNKIHKGKYLIPTTACPETKSNFELMRWSGTL
jgi:hypothetical protein